MARYDLNRETVSSVARCATLPQPMHSSGEPNESLLARDIEDGERLRPGRAKKYGKAIFQDVWCAGLPGAAAIMRLITAVALLAVCQAVYAQPHQEVGYGQQQGYNKNAQSVVCAQQPPPPTSLLAWPSCC